MATDAHKDAVTWLESEGWQTSRFYLHLCRTFPDMMEPEAFLDLLRPDAFRLEPLTGAVWCCEVGITSSMLSRSKRDRYASLWFYLDCEGLTLRLVEVLPLVRTITELDPALWYYANLVEACPCLVATLPETAGSRTDALMLALGQRVEA